MHEDQKRDGLHQYLPLECRWIRGCCACSFRWCCRGSALDVAEADRIDGVGVIVKGGGGVGVKDSSGLCAEGSGGGGLCAEGGGGGVVDVNGISLIYQICVFIFRVIYLYYILGPYQNIRCFSI